MNGFGAGEVTRLEDSSSPVGDVTPPAPRLRVRPPWEAIYPVTVSYETSSFGDVEGLLGEMLTMSRAQIRVQVGRSLADSWTQVSLTT